MKKTILATIAVIVIASSNGIKAQYVQNGGFEIWSNSTVTGQLEPDSFITSEHFVADALKGPVPANIDIARRSTSRRSGSYAIDLVTYSGAFAVNGILINADSVSQFNAGRGGKPYKGKYFPVAMHGYYKFNALGGDTMLLQTVMSRYDNILKKRTEFGYGSYGDTTKATTFTEFFVPMAYSDTLILPDTFLFVAQGSLNQKTNGCKLSLDDLKLVYAYPYFEYSPANPKTNETVEFTNGTVNTAPIDSIRWNFGYQNATSTNNNPSFSYPVAGTYTVTLTVYCQGDELHYTQKITVTGTSSSVSQLNANALNVFPNPANDNINITNTPNAAYINIYDTKGQLVISQIADKFNTNTSINTSNLPPAMYLVRMYEQNGNLGAMGKFSVIK